MFDVVEEVSTLTTIEKKTLTKLEEKFEWCICDGLYKQTLLNNNKCFFDLGLGTLGIDYSNGTSIKYKFIPSKDFEKAVINTLTKKQSPLVAKTEQSLVKKITDAYKDLF